MIFKSLVLAVLAVLVLAPRADALLIFYNSRAAFDADAPGLPIEDFEEARVPPGTRDFMSGNLDKFTNNAFFLPGEILDGLRLRERPPLATNGLAIVGAGGLGGVVSKTIFATHSVSSLDLIFYNNDVTAAGTDLYSKSLDFLAHTIDVGIFGPGDVLLGTTSVVVPAPGGPVFWGVISTTDIITRINFNVMTGAGDPAIEGVDNIAFGRAGAPGVPEPSSLLLLGTGLLGLGLFRRRALLLN